jgi:hypothetical protein
MVILYSYYGICFEEFQLLQEHVCFKNILCSVLQADILHILLFLQVLNMLVSITF